MKYLALMLCIFVVGCSDAPPAPVRNRVPTMPAQPTPPPEPKREIVQEDQREDRPQHTNVGSVSSAIVKHQSLSNSRGWYMGFTFQEDGGFQKEFFPLCHGQVLLGGRVAIMYHWHPWENIPSEESPNSVGCFVIDGYQTK